MTVKKAKTSKVEKIAEVPQPIVAYKGFDKDLCCNPTGNKPFKYELGQTYTTNEEVVRCAGGGFHSCEMPLDVLTYYRPNTSRFAIVEIGGKVSRSTEKFSDSKIASATITIKAELKLPELIRKGIEWILERAKGNTATGDSGHAAATGDYGHAAATGYSGHAAATGNSGHAAATGNYGHAAATGYSGHAAATGDYGHAAATGNSGHAAATGNYGTAFTGFNGKAKAGATGAFAIAWFDSAAKRARLIVGTPGENGIKADTFYSVNSKGELEQVK